MKFITRTKIIKFLKAILLITILSLLSACSVEKDTMTSLAYHNTLARYNGYFMAKESMKEIEKTIAASSDDNFSRILKIHPKVTPAIVSTINPQLEEVIKKASLPIQRHKNSRWVDNSYTLVGRSRYYKLDYDNAAITFKYVNSKSDTPDDKHEALCWLLRTFTQTEQYDNAFSVISFLGKEELSKKNIETYTLAKAELYQILDDKEAFLEAVTEASDVVRNRNNKARTSFIMGQLNQKAENDEDAYVNYKRSIRKSPTYEMAFYARLYMAQVKSLGKENDAKKVIRFYKKMLRDEKNIDYKDKIYYEMAQFEYKQTHFPPALDYLRQSLRANKGNQNQKAYSYLKMAEIYDNDLKNYRQAAYYYDSTLTVLAKDEENYEAIKKRGEILKEFVEQITIIETEDSLQALANMDSLKLIAFLNDQIKAEEEKLKEALDKKKKLAEQKQQSSNQQNNLNLLNNAQGGSASASWYFYNPSSISQGKAKFTLKWGDRTLEDNWRRKSKEKILFEEEEVEEDTASSSITASSGDQDQIDDERYAQKRADLMKKIPFSPEALAISNGKLEEALYKLGLIYNLKLFEKQDASDTYERLIKRFPENENKLEVYYILFLINKELDMEKSNYYKNLLINKYPNSVFAKLVLDPEYLIKNEKLNKQAQYKYAEAYKLHQNEQFNESTAICNNVITTYPDNDIMDKLDFLKALNIGLQDTTILIFKAKMEDFITKFPESELVPLAEEYLKGIKAFINKQVSNKETIIKDNNVAFSLNKNETHFFIVVFNNKETKQSKIQNNFSQFNENNWGSEKYKTLPMILNKDKFMIIVQEFKNSERAMNYYSTINVTGNILKGTENAKFDSFVISKENFNVFFAEKALEDYLSFFRNNYILTKEDE